MRAGQRMNLLRATANELLTYGRHRTTCKVHREPGSPTCSCGWDAMKRNARAILATEREAKEESRERWEANTPPKHDPFTDADFGSFGGI